MGDVISIGIPSELYNPWTLVKYKEQGYEVVKYEYNHFLHEHFYLLRKVGD